MKKNGNRTRNIRLKFLGGVKTVTGSSHLLITPKSNILIDSGLFYGRRGEFYRANTNFDFSPSGINAVVLSHAHIDHCGNIPTLLKHGLRCKIYTTSATRDLCRLMLADSGRVQVEDFKYLSKIAHKTKRRKKMSPEERLRGPLYTERDGLRSITKFRPLHYGQRFKITNDVTLTFFDAGHILGSSITLLEVRTNGSTLRLGYAVDLGREELPLLNNPVVLKDLDYLIIESTYGDRLHSSIEEARVKLRDTISRTIARKGKLIIPSFALERTQEVVYSIGELMRDGSIPRVPIYVDSPLATKITEVFRKNVHYMNQEIKSQISRDASPFDFLNLHYVQNQAESKALNIDKRPMIIIAGSGMCEAGRVLHHLKNNITESRNTVLIVGFMAKDTLGRKIVEKEKIVRIYGLEYELNAEVVVINALSGHADRNGLVRYVRDSAPSKQVFLVHGDEEQIGGLSRTLAEQGISSYVPEKNEEVVLYNCIKDNR